MTAYINLTIIFILYSNLIRYWELRRDNTMFTFNQYLFNFQGIVYNLNIIGFSIVIYLISKIP